MSDIVARLRDWRNVHLARLHLLMEEAADEIARLRADNNRRANLEQGLRDGIERLSANGDCPEQDNATNRDTLTVAEREAVEGAIEAEHRRGAWKWAETLRGLLERMLDTPAANATPSEGIEQNRCTLADAEREAVEYFAAFHQSPREADASAAATLRGLLERTK